MSAGFLGLSASYLQCTASTKYEKNFFLTQSCHCFKALLLPLNVYCNRCLTFLALPEKFYELKHHKYPAQWHY